MKRNGLAIGFLLVGWLLVGAMPAQADNVVIVGYNSFNTLDGGATDHDGAQNGVFTVDDGDLTIATGGSINCNDNDTDQPPPAVIVPNSSACDITIVVSGSLFMQPGSAIKAENQVSGGNGGNINITVGGNVLLAGSDGVNPGALISSRKISGAGDTGNAGHISIRAGDTTCETADPQAGDVTVELGAQILANGTGNAGDITVLAGRDITIDGRVESRTSTTVGRGGVIGLIACCDLRVGVTGIVSSRGSDPGADLVHIEGCTVVILGLVESVGPGHNDAGVEGPNLCQNDGVHFPPAGKTFRACVEIWSGSTLIIDASGQNNGQVVAEATGVGGTTGSSWIDIYANGDISIFGNVIPPFAVHANQLGANTAHAGQIAIKSKAGDVTATNLAVQADATNAGSNGGKILLEAAVDVTLDTATLSAQGDSNQTGGYGKGGRIDIRAYQGAVSWANGTGNVMPTGTDNVGTVLPAASRGVIVIQGCSYPNATFNTTSFPNVGAPATTPTIIAAGTCVGMPTIPDPAGTRLAEREDCAEHCETRQIPPPPFFCEKAPVRTVLDNFNGRFPGNQGADLVVRVDLGGSIQAAITAAAAAGFDAAHNNDGYVILAVSAHADGSLGGHTTQSFEITDPNYEFPFALIGCSVTAHDPTPGDGVPTARIASSMHSPEWPPLSGITAFLMDLHAADSAGAAGWKVEAETDFDGGGRYVRNTYGTNSLVGLYFTGDKNVMHNGKGENNVNGIKVVGNSNLITDADAFYNSGDGVYVYGNNNTLKGIDAGDRGKGNGGNGIWLYGNGNQLNENSAFANGVNGFWVGSTVGAPNILYKNAAGDRGKANGANGYLINGAGNGTTIDINENSAKANVLNGFWFTGGNHKLKNNKSGGSGAFPGGEDNGDCEYKFDAANVDGGGNKANGAGVSSFTAGSCKGTP